MEPFLKWAGGKRWLIPKIVNRLPKYSTYYEPFLGSGSLFFAIKPEKAVLSDSNRDLINCYRRIKYNCEQVIKLLRKLRVTKKNYYLIRDNFRRTRDPIKRAAFFIFLNQLCWNGLYRVNSDGIFNVPIGSYKRKKPLYTEDSLKEASRLLKKAVIKCCDFEKMTSKVRKNDLIYFDPPYITSHMKNGFIKYNAKLFHHSDELRLAVISHKLTTKNAYVMVSNSSHPLIRQMYDGPFNKYLVNRRSSIAADISKRGEIKELLVTNFDLSM